MRMFRRILIAGGLLLSATGAVAQDAGWYLGGALGRSQIGVDTVQLDSEIRATGFATSSTSADETNTSWKAFLGYQFSRNFALEGGYGDLGKFSIRTVTTGPAATISNDIRAKAWFIDVVGSVPFSEQISVYGKLGLHRWNVETRAIAVSGGAATALSVSDEGANFKYGVGGRYDFTKNVGLRLEWERYTDVGDRNTTGRGDVDLFSLGLVIRF